MEGGESSDVPKIPKLIIKKPMTMKFVRPVAFVASPVVKLNMKNIDTEEGMRIASGMVVELEENGSNEALIGMMKNILKVEITPHLIKCSDLPKILNKIAKKETNSKINDDCIGLAKEIVSKWKRVHESFVEQKKSTLQNTPSSISSPPNISQPTMNETSPVVTKKRSKPAADPKSSHGLSDLPRKKVRKLNVAKASNGPDISDLLDQTTAPIAKPQQQSFLESMTSTNKKKVVKKVVPQVREEVVEEDDSESAEPAVQKKPNKKGFNIRFRDEMFPDKTIVDIQYFDIIQGERTMCKQNNNPDGLNEGKGAEGQAFLNHNGAEEEVAEASIVPVEVPLIPAVVIPEGLEDGPYPESGVQQFVSLTFVGRQEIGEVRRRSTNYIPTKERVIIKLELTDDLTEEAIAFIEQAQTKKDTELRAFILRGQKNDIPKPSNFKMNFARGLEPNENVRERRVSEFKAWKREQSLIDEETKYKSLEAKRLENKRLADEDAVKPKVVSTAVISEQAQEALRKLQSLNCDPGSDVFMRHCALLREASRLKNAVKKDEIGRSALVKQEAILEPFSGVTLESPPKTSSWAQNSEAVRQAAANGESRQPILASSWRQMAQQPPPITNKWAPMVTLPVKEDVVEFSESRARELNVLPCKFFSQGNCRFDINCSNLHGDLKTVGYRRVCNLPVGNVPKKRYENRNGPEEARRRPTYDDRGGHKKRYLSREDRDHQYSSSKRTRYDDFNTNESPPDNLPDESTSRYIAPSRV
uniref:C3H1-type domain-containing protein n=1 Tax=Rhabditophanes sp. KR3021 TaxID=114890 RepID=A0AC35UG50_9BILA